MEKYKDKLPIKIKRTFSDNEKFNILIASGSITEPIMELLLELKDSKHNVTFCGDHIQLHNIIYLKEKRLTYPTLLIHHQDVLIGDGKWTINTPKGPVLVLKKIKYIK